MAIKLSNGKEIVEVFKRIHRPSRFVPLQEIKWRDEYYLSGFVHKFEESFNEINVKRSRLKDIFLCNMDLRCVYIDIALIVLRINEDGARINRTEELFDITSDRGWTASETEEYEKLRYAVNYFNLDVRSLLIHILIFMDKLAKILSLLIDKKDEKLGDRSFFHFKSDLRKLRGTEIEELSQLIDNNTE